MNPLEILIAEIEAALAAGFHRLAITAALTLPDVCAALQEPDHYSGKGRYKAWYDVWLAPVFPWMTADDCYSLRCGVIHKGELGLAGSQFKRVVFTLPNERDAAFHNSVVQDVLQFDAIGFCRDITRAVRAWAAAEKDNPTVASNMDNVLRYRPQGLAPYFVGLPIIA